MRRSLAAVSVLVVCMAGLPLTARAATGGVSIRTVDADRSPVVDVTVSFDEEVQVGTDQVQVTENAGPVEVTSVEPLDESGRTVDVVLAIDVSGSMEGPPLAAAIEAARAFVHDLPDDVRVGVLTFSDSANVAQPLTSVHREALGTLRSLRADGETALYDAVAAAAAMFDGDAQRNVILLSDGGDTVSEGRLTEAVGAASDAGAAIFSVGLTTGEADVAALRTISDRTGGRYAPAGTADLSGVYAGLATELANQFLISYLSGSEPGAEVSLQITTPVGADTVLLALPAAEAVQEASPVPAPVPVPQPDPILEGTWGLGVVLGLTFLSILLLSVLVFGTGARRRRDRELARRMATQQRARPGQERGDVSRGLASLVPEPIIAVADRAARAGGFSETLNDRLERADAPFRAGEFLIGSMLAVLVGALAAYALFDSVFFALVFAVVAGAIPHLIVAVELQRRSTRIHGQLPDVLLLLSSSLRAGHSFLQALDGVSQEIGEPAAHELSRVVAEVRLGRPVDQAMNGLADRVRSEDFRWAVLAVNVQRDVGGNLAEVLDTVAETLREREVIRRQVKVLSAEGRLSAWILSLLPLLLALYISRVNPSYMKVLFTSRIGLIMLIGAGTLMVIGILWLRRLVRIDV